jgi:sulfur-oxidizing protein SoxY
MSEQQKWNTTRRAVLLAAGALAVGTGGGGAAAQTLVRPAVGTADAMQAAIRKVAGGADVKKGKVKLDVPPLSENGNTVACSVEVDSPMTPKDYVKAIHIFTEKNPQPYVVSVHLGARAGRAAFATRMRLADTQTITAVAELSDGTFWSDSADVIITLGACLED